jgi:hypothetical protein
MANEKRLIEYFVIKEKNTGLYFRGKGENRWGKYYNQASIYRMKGQAENTADWLCKNGEPVEIVQIQIIESASDVVEVVHGRWLYDCGSGKHFCSACDEYALSFKKDTLYGGDLYEVCLTDYCPNCGAKMDGDGNG